MIGIIAVYFYLSLWLNEHCNRRFMKVVCNILSAPVILVYLAISCTPPFLTIIGTYLFVAVYVFGAPAIVMYGLNNYFCLGLLSETIGFVAIAIGSILSTHYEVTKFVVRWSPLRNNGEHKYEEYRERLAYYLIHPSNMVFLLYLVYFILMVITGYKQIQYGGSLLSEGYDAAILKAFLVFISFTNMKTKAQSSDLDLKELYDHTRGLFIHDDKDWLMHKFNARNRSGDDEIE